MFDTRTRLFFFACLKDATGAGAALKCAAPAPTSKKISSRAALEVAAPVAPALQHCATYRLLQILKCNLMLLQQCCVLHLKPCNISQPSSIFFFCQT